jgi:hypothetical protein
LRVLVEKAASDRRRAAASALGELQDTAAIPTLSDVLSVKDDRLVGDAAWALGEIAVSQPTHPRAKQLIERWLYLGKHGGWAAAINGTGALARYLWALPRDGRNVTSAATLSTLAFHKSRLVRINAALALSSLTGDDAAAKTLIQLLEKDASPHVRIAAAHGLARIAVGANKDFAARIATALNNAARNETDSSVIEATQQPAAALPALNNWRTFQVVDPSADDAPVRQEPYFVQGPDEVVWASYTDARGELNSEHIAPGTEQEHVHPASREPEY